MPTSFKAVLPLYLTALLALGSIAPAQAGVQGNADEAKAMVQKGVAFEKTAGKAKLLAEVMNKQGQFNDRDLYISVWDLKANVLAHGANPRMVGKDIIELKDADDKFFMKEVVAKAAAAGSGWVDYKWVNPVSKEIQAKSAYFEKVDGMIISSGYYKK